MYEKIAELLYPYITKTIADYEKMYPPRAVTGYVTRFAPSPTGFVHIGSLYTSYISFLFAKQSEGLFYLRIEDTDQKREVENGIEGILRDLKSFDIVPEEGPLNGGNYAPYIQTQRVDIYKACAKELIQRGYAYPCFMKEDELDMIRKSQEQNKDRIGIYGKYAKCRNLSYEEIKTKIDAGESFVIRLKSPGDFTNRISFQDEIKGDISFPENDLDVILLKENGIPTYHFAHAVDDHFMRTNLVIRGDEWLSSVPIHKQLFDVLGFSFPHYAHISPLTKREGDTVRKLSKRKDPECSVTYYFEKGIPSEVLKLYFRIIMNPDYEQFYLAHPKDSVDSFPFSLSKMPIGGTLFDKEKLESISKIYFSYLTADEIYDGLVQYTKEYDPSFYAYVAEHKEDLLAIFNIERGGDRPRKDIGSYSSIQDLYWYFFAPYFEERYSEKLAALDVSSYDLQLVCQYFTEVYSEKDSEDIWFSKVKTYAEENGYAKEVKEYKKNPENYKGHIGNVCEMIRVVTCLEKQTPNLYHMLQVLGKEECIRRAEKMLLVFGK